MHHGNGWHQEVRLVTEPPPWKKKTRQQIAGKKIAVPKSNKRLGQSEQLIYYSIECACRAVVYRSDIAYVIQSTFCL